MLLRVVCVKCSKNIDYRLALAKHCHFPLIWWLAPNHQIYTNLMSTSTSLGLVAQGNRVLMFQEGQQPVPPKRHPGAVSTGFEPFTEHQQSSSQFWHSTARSCLASLLGAPFFGRPSWQRLKKCAFLLSLILKLPGKPIQVSVVTPSSNGR